MARNSISDELIIETSARLSNKVGLDNLSLKMIAEELDIKSPSLYNHISSLDEIKERLMLYGWKEGGGSTNFMGTEQKQRCGILKGIMHKAMYIRHKSLLLCL